MDEWLKIHTYVVYSNKQWAVSAMQNYYRYHTLYLHQKLKRNISKQTISSKFRVRKYVSINQVLNYFDGVDNVDYFELDSSATTYQKIEDIIRCIKILKNASMRRYERGKLRDAWISSNKRS